MSCEAWKAIAHQALALGPFPWLRHQPGGRQATLEGVTFTTQDMPGPGANFAAVLGTAPPLDTILALAKEFFAGCEEGYGILVEGGAGHSVETEMRDRGFPIAEDEPALVMPSLPGPTSMPEGLEIRPAGDQVTLDDSREVTASAFGVPVEVMERWGPSLAFARDPDLGVLVGYCAGVPVTSVVLFRCAETVGLAGVCTAETHRGRGFGTAITTAALQAGAARGCRSAALRSGPASYSMYTRMGFVPVCRHRTYAVPIEAG